MLDRCFSTICTGTDGHWVLHVENVNIKTIYRFLILSQKLRSEGLWTSVSLRSWSSASFRGRVVRSQIASLGVSEKVEDQSVNLLQSQCGERRRNSRCFNKEEEQSVSSVSHFNHLSYRFRHKQTNKQTGQVLFISVIISLENAGYSASSTCLY